MLEPLVAGFTTPNLARVYDYALGGKDNFAADRALYERLSAVYPEYRGFAVANRAFMRQAVARMAAAGIDQFLDLGAGIPTSPNVHEVARELIPDARVVYVDRDPVVRTHTEALSARWPGVAVVQHDLRDPAAVLADPVVRGTLDLTRPLGLLCIAVLHFVCHDESLRVMARYRAALATGSQVAISVHTPDPAKLADPLAAKEGDDIACSLDVDIVGRTPAEIDDLFTGLAVQDPGVVDVAHWRTGRRTRPLWCLAGIADLR